MKFLRAKAFCFALVFCAGASTLTSASGNAAPLSDYLFQVWQTDQGLPENSATAMVQTPDGYLWFGTFNGLVRFDGVKFKVFDRFNTPELPGTGIVNLYLDHSGRLWVSTLTGTAYVKDGRWRIFHDSDGWPGSYVWRFAETSSGDLYLTTWDHKLLRFRSDRFELIPQPPVSRPTLGFQSFVDGCR
jgi:ligand-binding sensor domain-containing protein